MSRPLRVACLQPLCSGSGEEVVKRAARMVAGASRAGAEIVCLPEHWLLGKRPHFEDALSALQREAARSRVVVIAGAGFVRHDQEVAVQSPVFDKTGEELGRQSKTHLYGKERSVARPGDDYKIFESAGVKFGIAICHDLVYPEVARTFALRGADVIFSPARITTAGIEPWHLYLKARALENRIPVVSPNVLAPPRCMGESMIVGLRAKGKIVYPEVLKKGGSTQQILHAKLDLKTAERTRRQRLADRRPETYSALTVR
jgi:predicted amidohydrolase